MPNKPKTLILLTIHMSTIRDIGPATGLTARSLCATHVKYYVNMAKRPLPVQ